MSEIYFCVHLMISTSIFSSTLGLTYLRKWTFGLFVWCFTFADLILFSLAKQKTKKYYDCSAIMVLYLNIIRTPIYYLLFIIHYSVVRGFWNTTLFIGSSKRTSLQAFQSNFFSRLAGWFELLTPGLRCSMKFRMPNINYVIQLLTCSCGKHRHNCYQKSEL